MTTFYMLLFYVFTSMSARNNFFSDCHKTHWNAQQTVINCYQRMSNFKNNLVINQIFAVDSIVNNTVGVVKNSTQDSVGWQEAVA